MPETASDAPGSPPPEGPCRLRSCRSASFASDNSSAMTSAANRISRASPTWPTVFVNSPTFASTYWARRRMRDSCPSAQVSGNSRPFTLTTTWPISVLPVEQPIEPGKRRVQLRRHRFGDHFYLILGWLPRLRRCGFEPGDGRREPRHRVVEFAHRWHIRKRRAASSTREASLSCVARLPPIASPPQCIRSYFC